jgi:superfamily I DNA and/or RNA helicase
VELSYLDKTNGCDFNYFVLYYSLIFIDMLYSFGQVLNSKLLKAKDRNTKRDIRKELKTLAKEERKRQQLAVADVIKNADVVLSTLTGASSKKLAGITFDLVIIDEAAQALEVACWIALLKVGYNLQLQKS